MGVGGGKHHPTQVTEPPERKKKESEERKRQTDRNEVGWDRKPPGAQHRLKLTVTTDDPLKPPTQTGPVSPPRRARESTAVDRQLRQVDGRGGHSTLPQLPSTNNFCPLAAGGTPAPGLGSQQPGETHNSPAVVSPSLGKLCSHTPAAPS